LRLIGEALNEDVEEQEPLDEPQVKIVGNDPNSPANNKELYEPLPKKNSILNGNVDFTK
jgi:hypothetical protein